MNQHLVFPVGDFIVLTRNWSGNFGRKHVTKGSNAERSGQFHGDLYAPVVARSKSDYSLKFLAQVRRKNKVRKRKERSTRG